MSVQKAVRADYNSKEAAIDKFYEYLIRGKEDNQIRGCEFTIMNYASHLDILDEAPLIMVEVLLDGNALFRFQVGSPPSN